MKKVKNNKYVFGIFKLCYILLFVSAIYVLRLQFICENDYMIMLKCTQTPIMCEYLAISLIILTGGYFTYSRLS